MISRYIHGDITQTELKYIAHGVNCQNKMGSGVAKALYEKFPAVKTRYHSYINTMGCSPELLLGEHNTVETEGKVIFNLFTQLNFGYDGKRYVSYKAIVNCFENLVTVYRGNTIAIPKIGCGLAGGDWKIVEQLINDTVGDDLEIWVYHLDNPKLSSSRNDLG